jgi:SAM-dependent methyltransferase
MVIGIVGLGQYSVQNAIFSPYNRILLMQDKTKLSLNLEVNRDFHQYLHNLSDARLADPSLSDEDIELLKSIRNLYNLPFVVNANRGSALVVGAGTGNDVQAALRNGYKHIESIDIDGRIIALGRAHHPEKPYANQAVTAVVDDARSYFEKHPERKFDVVCYGFLDSHAMSSSMSTLRLDNYVYTEEGLRAAWKRVGENGHLTLAISCIAGPWFFERLYWTLPKPRAKNRELTTIHYTML